MLGSCKQGKGWERSNKHCAPFRLDSLGSVSFTTVPLHSYQILGSTLDKMTTTFGILALASLAQAQFGGGGGGRGGGGGGGSQLAMLRFGCSQTVIDRIDP